MLRAVAVRCCWFALLLLSTHAAAQIQPVTPNDSAKYSLSGTVVNSVTGEPIRRALVQIGLGAALTDGNGRFEFDNLPPSQTSINVRKPGFFDEHELRRDFSNPPMATIGPDSQPVVVKLVPESVVYGRIQNIAGEPIERLPIRLITTEIVEGRKRWQQTEQATTNDDGEFRIANLRPGTYYLETGPGSRSRLVDSTSAYPLLFYPGVSDLSAATPLEITPGRQLNIDLSVRPAPIFKVSGTIAGITPDQGVGLQLKDQLGNDYSMGERFESKTGKFQAMAPAGSYTLIANAWGTGVQSSAELPVNVTSDLAGVRLALAPQSQIPVNVRTEVTHSSSKSLTVRPNMTFPNIRLISDSQALFSPEFGAMTLGDPKNPSLALRNVTPGKYSVEVTANPPWYVQSAQCGDIDLLREQLTIAAGIQTPPIEVVLRDDVATLIGKLNAAGNARQATVILVPEHGYSIRTVDLSFDSTAEFSFGDIAPGSYSVYAFDRIYGLEYRNPDVLARYSSKAAHVTLQPNEQHKIDLELIRLEEKP